MFIVTQVKKLLYFAQDGKSFIWPNRRYTYTSQLIYKKSGKNNKNCIGKNKFTTQLKSYLTWISYEQRDKKSVSHFLFCLSYTDEADISEEDVESADCRKI